MSDDNEPRYRLAFPSCVETGSNAAPDQFFAVEDHFYQDDGSSEHSYWTGEQIISATQEHDESQGGRVQVNVLDCEQFFPGSGTVERTEARVREMLNRFDLPASEEPLVQRGDVVTFSTIYDLGEAVYIRRPGQPTIKFQGWYRPQVPPEA